MPPELSARLASLSTASATEGQLVGEFRAGRRMAKEGDAGKDERKEMLRQLGEQSADARLSLAVDSPRQLEEVLVDFWFNHFNVFAGKGIDRVLVANYERQAIRPYVLGHFRELLGATRRTIRRCCSTSTTGFRRRLVFRLRAVARWARPRASMKTTHVS